MFFRNVWFLIPFSMKASSVLPPSVRPCECTFFQFLGLTRMRIEPKLQTLVMCAQPTVPLSQYFSTQAYFNVSVYDDQHRSWQNSNETKKSYCSRWIFKQNQTQSNIIYYGYHTQKKRISFHYDLVKRISLIMNF